MYHVLHKPNAYLIIQILRFE